MGRRAHDGEDEDDIREADGGRQSQQEPWLLSSSYNPSSHREPTRSFIPGSIRDHLGMHLEHGAPWRSRVFAQMLTNNHTRSSRRLHAICSQRS